jgi:hypothetical protein
MTSAYKKPAENGVRSRPEKGYFEGVSGAFNREIARFYTPLKIASRQPLILPASEIYLYPGLSPRRLVTDN